MIAAAIVVGFLVLGCIAAWAGNRVVRWLDAAKPTDKTQAESNAEQVRHFSREDALRTLGWRHDYLRARWINDEALELGMPPPHPSQTVDPFGLASWMNVSGGHRITLNNGLSFEGFGRCNWLVYPTGEDAADWAEDVCHALAQQIKWGQHKDKQELTELEKHDRRLAECRSVAERIPERIGQVATAVDNAKLYAGHVERERRLQKERDERQARIEAQMGAAALSGYAEGLRNGYPAYTSGRLPVRVTDKPSSFESYVQWNSREELDELLSDPKMVEEMGLERKEGE